jgi:hypothetical protein
MSDLSLRGTDGSTRNAERLEKDWRGLRGTYQDASRSMATTDARPPTGMESSATVDVCNCAVTNGNKCQDKALLVAGRRVHGGKPNRVPTGHPMTACAPRQGASSHMTITSTTRITRTRVTRDFGIAFIPAVRVRRA